MSELVARISNEPLSTAEVEVAVQDSRHGAVVLFSGIVRDHDGGHAVETLEYRAHPDAERFLSRCCSEVSAETGLAVAAVHRVGDLRVALVAAVGSAHRAEAFEACARLVERIKAEVPIWKRQGFEGGRTEWVGL